MGFFCFCCINCVRYSLPPCWWHPDPFLPDACGVHKLYAARGLGFTSTLTPGLPGDDRKTLAAETDRLAAAPLLFHPGTQWMYGYSTDVLGRLVEVLSGEALDAFCDKHILRPLGMHDTAYWVPPDKVGRFAACYIRAPAAAGAAPGTPQFRVMDDGSSYHARTGLPALDASVIKAVPIHAHHPQKKQTC